MNTRNFLSAVALVMGLTILLPAAADISGWHARAHLIHR
jgi:hypothetical protein